MTFRVLWWPLAFLDRDLCQNIHIIRVYLKLLSIKTSHHNTTLSIFFSFFYQGFLSRTRTIHRTAGEGRGPFFIPLYHFHPLMNIQTFICNFACENTIHIFNRNACIYQTATQWYFTTLSNYHLFDWLMMWSYFCLLDDLILSFCYSTFDTGNRWTRTITLVLQANRLTKCASHFI